MGLVALLAVFGVTMLGLIFWSRRNSQGSASPLLNDSQPSVENVVSLGDLASTRAATPLTPMEAAFDRFYSDGRRLSSFGKLMDDLAALHGGHWYDARVAGVAYYNDDGSSRQTAIRGLAPGEVLGLEAEPDNQYDPNAVRVLDGDGRQIGFLGKRHAEEFAACQRRGECFMALVAEVTPEQNVEAMGVHIGVLRWFPTESRE